jgi:hypothetical protein
MRSQQSIGDRCALLAKCVIGEAFEIGRPKTLYGDGTWLPALAKEVWRGKGRGNGTVSPAFISSLENAVNLQALDLPVSAVYRLSKPSASDSVCAKVAMPEP